MPAQPPALLTYTCKHCGALIALLTPGALVYDTRLKCGQCSSIVLIIRGVDNKRLLGLEYTQQPA
jgi:DNA-directed RNA polymerase subunit RPC12/RpoP